MAPAYFMLDFGSDPLTFNQTLNFAQKMLKKLKE